jgi:hypothetical protein
VQLTDLSVVLLHCAAISEALQCSTVFRAFASNLKNFKNFLNCLLLSARGLIRFAEALKFEFQNISAKPCSLARFFVPSEKIFAFFHFLKS